MGSEGSLWKTLDKNMRKLWTHQRVENPAGPGTPDLYVTMNNGTMNWIELKHVHQWPKRDNTPVRVDHFTPQQKSFLRRHGKLGANVYVLIQIERDYFLLPWQYALQIGELSKEDYLELAKDKIWHWHGRLDYKDFALVISY